MDNRKKTGISVAVISMLLIMGSVYWSRRSEPEPRPAPEVPASAAASEAPQSTSLTEIGDPETVTDNGETVVYTPKQIIQTTFGPVRISEGTVTDAGHVSSGKVAVYYLNADGKTVRKAFVPAVESGSFGQIGKVTVRSDFGPYPVLLVEGGGTWQGYSCGVTTPVELTPDGPVVLADVPTTYSNSGAVEDGAVAYEGQIQPRPDGKGFDVVYTGEGQTFTETYLRKGQTFTGPKTSRMPTC